MSLKGIWQEHSNPCTFRHCCMSAMYKASQVDLYIPRTNTLGVEVSRSQNGLPTLCMAWNAEIQEQGACTYA
ncbi:hypothetical protein XENTR_v10014985 [Xenopus tropicalis]|nr:hypothetical protein XENTR_v10014985 [Xenopus tropicalis]